MMTITTVFSYLQWLPIAMAGFNAGLYAHMALYGPLQVFSRREAWVISIGSLVCAMLLGLTQRVFQ